MLAYSPYGTAARSSFTSLAVRIGTERLAGQRLSAAIQSRSFWARRLCSQASRFALPQAMRRVWPESKAGCDNGGGRLSWRVWANTPLERLSRVHTAELCGLLR